MKDEFEKIEAELKIKFNAPLNELDSESQTYGCRANNPSICSYCYMPKVCAFVTEDKICRQPSKRWSKQYQKLKAEKRPEN